MKLFLPLDCMDTGKLRTWGIENFFMLEAGFADAV